MNTVLGKIRVTVVGSRKMVECTVRHDVVDLLPAVTDLKLSFSHEEHREHGAYLITDQGRCQRLFISSMTPPTAMFEPDWRNARLVFDAPPYRRSKPSFKDVPANLKTVDINALVRMGVPLQVAEGFKDSWMKGSLCKLALHKHNLIYAYLAASKHEPHGSLAQASKIDLREFLACPSGDTKRMGKELKKYTLSPSGQGLLRHLKKYPSSGVDMSRWVVALTGTPEEVGHKLWVDHSEKQLHPGQRYAAANVKDFYLPGVVNFALDMVKSCPDCHV